MMKTRYSNFTIPKSLRLLVLFSILTILSGCVYYNTFYNARKAFNEAEDKRKEAQYKGGRIATGQYNTAIEKSLKVIENYPNSKWYDDALYVLGVSYFHTSKFGKADRRFRELLANYSDSKYARESELYLAKTKLELKEEEEAMNMFEEIFNSKASKSFKTDAAMGLGIYHYGNSDYKASIPYFQAVRDSLGNKNEKKIAQTYIADGYFEMFRFQNALSAYMQLLGMEPSTDERYHALFQASSCAFSLLRIEDGMDYVNQLMEDELYFDSTNTLKMQLAYGYEIEDDLESAIDLYEQITEDDGHSNKQNAGLAHYRLGLIYQFDYDNLVEAKTHYDEANKLIGRTTDEGKDALERSSDIGKLETFARTLVVDSTTTQEMIDEAAFTQYQLAELYWFSLNKPDTAILEMQYLIDSFPSAYDVPKAMIALSEMYRDYKGDTNAADSILNTMLEEYPHSDFVPQALEALDLIGTEADTGYAKYYLDKAEDFLVDDSLIDSAKYYYQYIVDNYPESNYYLQSRFALIWIDEEYNPPGDSTIIVAYNAFIDSFPTTQWAQEAKGRMDRSQLVRSGRRIEEDVPDTLPDGTILADNTQPGGQYGATASGAAGDSADAYLDPLEAIYIDPEGNKAITMPLEPTETRDQFEYPVEAYKDEFEGDIYFQIFLDFTGEVVDYIQKTRSGNDEIDREASEAVASMIFDPLRIPPETVGSWFVYKFKVRLPDKLR